MTVAELIKEIGRTTGEYCTLSSIIDKVNEYKEDGVLDSDIRVEFTLCESDGFGGLEGIDSFTADDIPEKYICSDHTVTWGAYELEPNVIDVSFTYSKISEYEFYCGYY